MISTIPGYEWTDLNPSSWGGRNTLGGQVARATRDLQRADYDIRLALDNVELGIRMFGWPNCFSSHALRSTDDLATAAKGIADLKDLEYEPDQHVKYIRTGLLVVAKRERQLDELGKYEEIERATSREAETEEEKKEARRIIKKGADGIVNSLTELRDALNTL